MKYFAAGIPKQSIKSKAKSTSITKNSVKKDSIIFIFKNKIKVSKINVKHVELIEGMDADSIKQRFSIKGSKAKILENMVTDYKDGKLSLPGLSHKSKFDEKILNKSRIIQIITDYESAKKQREIEDINKSVDKLKKKFDLSLSRTTILDNLFNNLKKGTLENLQLFRKKLDSKSMDKDKFNDLFAQYQAADKYSRGISFLLTKSKLSIIASKRKLTSILNSIKEIRSLSKVFQHSNSVDKNI